MRRGSTVDEINQQLVREPAVPAYLAAGGRRLDPDPSELGHRRHEIAEEGTVVRRAIVDRAARGVEEVGVHGRIAADPTIWGQKAKKISDSFLALIK